MQNEYFSEEYVSPYFKPLQPSMLRRCKGWDYSAPSIYMITLTLADRSKPLLGKVIPVMPSTVARLEDLPQQLVAEFSPSQLGLYVLEQWKHLGVRIPEIRPLYLQLMEEHLHGILRVMRRMHRPLGCAIGAFKTGCNNYYRTLSSSNDTLFSEGFQDSILLGEGQLERMFQYLRDNPRRLAIRRLCPDFFTRLQQTVHNGDAYMAYGNLFLLDKPFFYQLQVSRSATAEALSFKRREICQAIGHGAVVVSPCISQGERTLMREAVNCGASLIALQKQGFPERYKPPGSFFDLCASGRLLMLAPAGWGYAMGKHKITREQCCMLNMLASHIAYGRG